jgi:hypothetical protein
MSVTTITKNNPNLSIRLGLSINSSKHPNVVEKLQEWKANNVNISEKFCSYVEQEIRKTEAEEGETST